MIKLTDSVIDSWYVLQKVIQNSEEVKALAECYQNGREQGFLLFGFPKGKAIYWSHHRNSDQIVVYVGEYSLQSISDDAYKHSYMADSLDDAVEYILDTAKRLSHVE